MPPPLSRKILASSGPHPAAPPLTSRPPLCRIYPGPNRDASPLQEVEEFSFITQLSGLTDHLPVAMRLMVSAGEEEA